MPIPSVLLCAHVKVLSALSGEPEVGFGCVAGPDGPTVLCRLTVETGSWRTLLLAADKAVSALAAHHGSPAAVPRPERGLPAPTADDVFDPYGSDWPADDTAALRVAAADRGARYVLRLRYRTDVLDGDCAVRIAGYHLTALALMAADLDAAPRPQSVVGPQELHHQVVGLAGPQRDLPDLRVHELFELRARSHPDAVAAVQGQRHWTYRELNARANRLAGALLTQGLRREEPVAVVSERNLGWMAAVLAVLKAGGAYLPVEPHFPADRITSMLTRSACRFALTEAGSSAALDRSLGALAEIRTVSIDTMYEGADEAANPQVPVPANSLAYIYFTSGSTGEPKGVMCEHAGMLNHLYAKIDDLGIGEGMTVAQSAPQCFDISLWQLLAGPLVGGRTLVVGQDTVLDVERYLDTLITGRVNVFQVVPSYLDTLLSSLERNPRELPDLLCVCVTGEALRKELVARCFAALPGIRLVNAYGLTETSDDTHHEVMDRVPDTDRIPLGRPVGNVRAYVLGPALEPIPLGAPGEIVFSGVCVGRGYVNDPERTRLAFATDPRHPGSRLYRSGDHGRWLQDGKLEFLGRHDRQVKVSGFRIELAEIDSALLRVPGVTGAAVIVARPEGHEPYVAAFYTASAPVDSDRLHDLLSAALPVYMVPSVFYRLDRLPVTANGKTDTKSLHSLTVELGRAGTGQDPPATPSEQQLAAVWSRALGTPVNQIGRQDRFFDLGGTSLSALRVVVALDRKISFADLTRHPRLSDLAQLLDRRPPRRGTR
ncbi:amino acid adenylation domain-containing protein [Streptomyces sp. NPDC058525]|uniref:amino acid adenylation domain-containing protein n=1 Tax=Streptomyces sp. NPDC058525 TaxID=3346538 RepID=UPI00366317F7